VSYTAEQVCKATGLTYRQLDHWVRQGYVDLPNARPGSGMPRTFTDHQLDRFGVIKALTDAGFRTSAAAIVAHNCPHGEWEVTHVQVQFDTDAIHDQLRKALANEPA